MCCSVIESTIPNYQLIPDNLTCCVVQLNNITPEMTTTTAGISKSESCTFISIEETSRAQETLQQPDISERAMPSPVTETPSIDSLLWPCCYSILSILVLCCLFALFVFISVYVMRFMYINFVVDMFIVAWLLFGATFLAVLLCALVVWCAMRLDILN